MRNEPFAITQYKIADDKYRKYRTRVSKIVQFIRDNISVSLFTFLLLSLCLRLYINKRRLLFGFY